MRLFFYGTLLDTDVLQLVLGPEARGVSLTAARLDGWRRERARGKTYPIILPDAAGSVAGAVSSTVTSAAVARLSAYEGPGYDLIPCRPVLADGSAIDAQVFRPTQRLAADGAAWELARWQAADKAAFLSRLRRGAGHA
jgi:hypothetical protein